MQIRRLPKRAVARTPRPSTVLNARIIIKIHHALEIVRPSRERRVPRHVIVRPLPLDPVLSDAHGCTLGESSAVHDDDVRVADTVGDPANSNIARRRGSGFLACEGRRGAHVAGLAADVVAEDAGGGAGRGGWTVGVYFSQNVSSCFGRMDGGTDEERAGPPPRRGRM